VLTRRGRAYAAAVAAASVVAAAAQAQAPAERSPAAPPPGPTAGPTSAPTAVPLRLPAALSADRPNIVVITADDMREDELRWMPLTRRLLGAEGVRFVNAFSPHSLCCPARASFLSGQYTHNHGVWANRPPHGGFQAFDDTRTVATRLAEVGYDTVFLGKYLNGYGRSPAPDGSAEDSFGYVPPGWVDWRGSVDGPRGWDHPDAGGTYRYFDTTLNVNGMLQGNPGRYQTRVFAGETEDIVAERARSPRPFFLWASYVAPHIGTPAEPDDPEPVARTGGEDHLVRTPARPARVRGMYDSMLLADPTLEDTTDVRGKPFFLRERPAVNEEERAAILTLARQRAESLHVLDQAVARTVTALEDAGVLEDTVVVFTSDNGYFLGEHRMRQGKNLPYEPSLRVPVLVRGPGIPAGEERADPFLTMDFAPTLLELAGARRDAAMDGVSRLASARDEDAGWTRPVFAETGPNVPFHRDDAPELLDRPEGPSSFRFGQGVRTPRWLYVEHASAERELYDVRTDPEQRHNRVSDPALADVTRRLARVLDRLRTCAGQSCADPLPASLRDGP
jgi:N-acetylglucosamine-6-sulfatase